MDTIVILNKKKKRKEEKKARKKTCFLGLIHRPILVMNSVYLKTEIKIENIMFVGYSTL